MCERESCGGLCRAMRQRTNAAAGHALPAILGALLLMAVAWVVTHIAGLLEAIGGIAAGCAALYLFARFGIPAIARRSYDRRQARQLPQHQPVYLVVPPSQRQLPGRDRYEPEYRVWSPEEYRRSRR